MNAADVTPGDLLLDKYRVERVLGRGGMGVVVAARHVELRELFAIKFLLPAALNHPQAVERFVREARASARLKGEHVARVQDVGRLPDGRPYMVLEHLAGNDLKETIKERGPLPVQEAATYVMQACEAVGEAHALGIVHRDLKPANLFLTRRPNGTPCVKVLDFGISKQLEPDDPEQHGLTKTGMLLGSPHYMAPEQMKKSKEADPRSDLWSLGCVLYELVTGRVPFHGDTLTELVATVLQEEPRSARELRGDLPAAVEAVIRRCLVKKREERYQTAHELAEALRAAAWSTSFESTARLQVAPDLPEPRDVPRAQPASDFEATVAFPAFSPAPASMPPPTPPAQPISVETPLPSLPSHGISSPAFSSTGPSVHTAQGWGATQPPREPTEGSSSAWSAVGSPSWRSPEAYRSRCAPAWRASRLHPSPRPSNRRPGPSSLCTRRHPHRSSR
jgi:serine/threonine protein kinase